MLNEALGIVSDVMRIIGLTAIIVIVCIFGGLIVDKLADIFAILIVEGVDALKSIFKRRKK